MTKYAAPPEWRFPGKHATRNRSVIEEKGRMAR